MTPILASTPALWYLARGSGTVSLGLLTLTVVLGITTSVRWATRRWPRLVVAGLHRNLSLLSLVFLGLHITTVVVDGYVPIRWLDAVVPFASSYHPLWLGLGALAFDILAALVVTSLLRVRLGHRVWRAVHWLNGGPATPTRTPPRPFQRGVDRRPTLIDNVETVAHLAQVLRFGPDWFRQLGTADEPGSALVTLSGAVERPGVYEVPIGAPLAQLVSRAAGAPEGAGAVLLGGYFGSWIGAEEASAASLSNGDLRRHGASLGCGAVVVLGASACGLGETARILAWLAGQTAGQCGPCVHGLAAIAGTTAALHDGQTTPADLDRLRRWAGQIEGRGACRLPDGAVRLLRSALEVFAGDVWRHLDGGSCPAGVRIVPPRTPAAAPIQRGFQWR
jgi:hypothetical protein